MATTKRYSETLKFSVESGLYKSLKCQADKRGESVAEVCRRILRNGVQKEILNDGVDVVTQMVREAVYSQLKPLEDRLAKLLAKNAINSGTGMYLNYFVIKEALGDRLPIPPKEIREDARKKAVAELREPITEGE